MVSTKIICLVKSTKQSPLQSSDALFDRMTIFTWNGGAEMSHVLFIHLHDPCFLVHSFLLYQGQKKSNKNSINRIKRIKKIINQQVICLLVHNSPPTQQQTKMAVIYNHDIIIRNIKACPEKRLKLHTSYYIFVFIF